MIFDSLDNFKIYSSLHPQFKNVETFFATRDFFGLNPGKYDVNDTGAYVIISTYTTRDAGECCLESHKKFIDIHCVLKGGERLGVCHKALCRELSYDPDKDFIKLQGIVDFISLKPGGFALLFPQDAHMPQVQDIDKKEIVLKAVIKVPV